LRLRLRLKLVVEVESGCRRNDPTKPSGFQFSQAARADLLVLIVFSSTKRSNHQDAIIDVVVVVVGSGLLANDDATPESPDQLSQLAPVAPVAAPPDFIRLQLHMIDASFKLQWRVRPLLSLSSRVTILVARAY
jgi:hypothetical protein